MKKLSVLLFLLLGIQPLFAQSDGLRLLTDSIDPNSGAVSLQWIDLEIGSQRPITTFNSTSYCTPAAFDSGNKLLYEPFSPGQASYTFQIDLNNGGILPIDAAEQLQLQCPVINPNEQSIAWISSTDVSDKVIVTDLDGSNPITLAEHPAAYDPMWSPDGNILIYTAVGEDETFRLLFAHADAPYSFWQRDAGLVIDYAWIPDGSALLLLYYTQDQAVLGRLDRACITTSETCQPTPLTMFNADAGLIFTDAFAPDNSAVVIIEEIYDAGELRSELYRVDTATGETLQLTHTPALIKTSAIWQDDSIYFVGAALDSATLNVSQSAIYRIPAEGGTPEVSYQADGYYPVQIIWHDS